jgi:hypothetical protein
MSTIASLIPSSSRRRIHKVVLWLKRIGLGLLITVMCYALQASYTKPLRLKPTSATTRRPVNS